MEISGLEIRARRKELKLTQEELAKQIGVSRNTIKNYENGGVIPESKRTILSNILFDKANQDSQTAFKNEVTPVSNSDYMMVEYVDLRASAGKLGVGDVDQLPETHKRLMPKDYAKGGYLVVRVDGDSMDDGSKRSLSDGDEVLTYEYTNRGLDELPIRKALFVITTLNGNVLKQITEINKEEGYIVCHSFNSEYPDFRIAFSEICQIFIVCKVVQKQISLV